MTSKNLISRAAFQVVLPLFLAALIVPMTASAQTGTLFVEGDQVGIGTATPTADLEILDSDYAALRLQTTGGSATWAFSATPAGDFTVNKIGSGGQEFTVNTRNNGDGKPTMVVAGSVQGWNFVNSSSRELKTDFSLLDGKEVLNRLSEIPVMSWRYKAEAETALHFGPVAEDFQAAFQLGDGRTITTIDADGVAFAAIQGLYTTVQEKDARIEQLEERIAKLEALVETLASQ
jgi:hypothetical protein